MINLKTYLANNYYNLSIVLYILNKLFIKLNRHTYDSSSTYFCKKHKIPDEFDCFFYGNSDIYFLTITKMKSWRF